MVDGGGAEVLVVDGGGAEVPVVDGGESEVPLFVPLKSPTSTTTSPTRTEQEMGGRIFYRTVKRKQEDLQKLVILSFMFIPFSTCNLFFLPAVCRSL